MVVALQVNSASFSSDDSRIVCGDRAKMLTVLESGSGEMLFEKEMKGEVRSCRTVSLDVRVVHGSDLS